MRSRLLLWGSIAAVILATFVISGREWYGTAQELAFDAILSLRPVPPSDAAVTVIDIDGASLNAIGPWPWRRDQIARLLKAVAAEEPKAVALDILLDGPDELSPAAMARKLAALTKDEHVGELANKVLDGDRELIDAVRAPKTVLGAVLDPAGDTKTSHVAPVLVRGGFNAGDLWQADGLIAPQEGTVAAAEGLALIAIPGDADGWVRRVPLIALAGGTLIPGLAVELHRLTHNAAAIILSQQPDLLAIGDLKLRIQSDGMLRLIPPNPADWPGRTISAQDLIQNPAGVRDRIRDHIVLVGSSAPEAGGLRPAGNGVLAPTVQLQADAFRQLSARAVPRRPEGVDTLEGVLAVFAGLSGALIGHFLAPRAGAMLILIFAALFVAGPAYAYLRMDVLIDPLLSSSAVVICFAITALSRASATLRREAAIRRRFEQHLAPAVARRIVEEPGLLRLAGEVREVTVLFTDVEGFTAMTARAPPRKLIAVLDAYFDGVSQIVIEHGGLIDKIVGDAVHALFNAPLDLKDHPQCALKCAIAIERFASAFCRRPLASELKFGRTRIGLETGAAIVGDVGGSRKLDYTAHGNAVNAAARFEAANKVLGTSLCIGPGAAGYIGPESLRPLGKITISGRDEAQDVFSLWPPDYTPADQTAFRNALAVAGDDRAAAVASLRVLAARRTEDLVLERLCERIAGAG